jgi:transcriptional regulator with XRE-family HTH domain
MNPIDRVLRKLNLSASELSRRTGISDLTISRVRRGLVTRFSPQIRELFRWAGEDPETVWEEYQTWRQWYAQDRAAESDVVE